MPAAIPLITLIVGAASAGVGAYESHDASINQAAAQKANADALKTQQQAQANQANLTKQEAVRSAQGQAQQQTGGSLTDPGTFSLADILAGYPGYHSSGSSTGGTPAIAPTSLSSGGAGTGTGTPDIASILATLRNGSSGGGLDGLGGGSISGGNWQTPPVAPQQWQELANPVIG